MSRLMVKLAVVLGAFLASTGAALADGPGGCVDSPENPTVILGLLGGAAAGLPWLKAQILSRRKARRAD